MAQGLSNAEVAEKLNLSIATVKSHTGRLFTKLAIKKRVQLALLIRDAQD
ncbi:response regulator transcription factor [Nocardia sp. CWNU-33]